MLTDPPEETAEASVVRGPSSLWYLLAASGLIGVMLLWFGADPPDEAARNTTPTTLTPAPTTPEPSPATSVRRGDSSVDEAPFLQGWFPNGTDYVVERPGAPAEAPTTVVVTIGTQDAGSSESTPRFVITLTHSSDGHDVSEWFIGVGSLETGSIAGEGDVIGLESEELATRLNLTVIDGFPRLEPRPPLLVLSGHSEIRYETFSVFDRCRAVENERCSDNGAVAVSTSRSDATTSIVSRAPRPTTDPHYFDPGPLEPRRSHRVWWSGTELLVFGGAPLSEPESFQPGVLLADGAAFDPADNTWRMLTPEEIEEGNAGADEQAAAWASPASALGGEGFAPQGAPGRVHPRYTVWTGSEFLAWGVPCCGGPQDPVGGFDTWRWSGS